MPKPTLKTELKQKRPFRIAEEEAYLNIIRTSNELNSKFFRFLKSFGITPVQYNILRILRGAGSDGLPGVEVVNRLVTKEPDITRLIDRLEKMVFVRRVRSQLDRRVIFVKITEQGMQLLEKLDKPSLTMLKELLGHMSKPELATVNQLMIKARKVSRDGTLG